MEPGHPEVREYRFESVPLHFCGAWFDADKVIHANFLHIPDRVRSKVFGPEWVPGVVRSRLWKPVYCDDPKLPPLLDDRTEIYGEVDAWPEDKIVAIGLHNELPRRGWNHGDRPGGMVEMLGKLEEHLDTERHVKLKAWIDKHIDKETFEPVSPEPNSYEPRFTYTVETRDGVANNNVLNVPYMYYSGRDHRKDPVISWKVAVPVSDEFLIETELLITRYNKFQVYDDFVFLPIKFEPE